MGKNDKQTKTTPESTEATNPVEETLPEAGEQTPEGTEPVEGQVPESTEETSKEGEDTGAGLPEDTVGTQTEVDSKEDELPEPEEKQEEQEPVQEEVPVNATLNEVLAIITAADLTPTEKIEKLKTCGYASIEILVATLSSYAEDMDGSKLVTPAVGAGRNYSLFVAIRNVANNEDKALFKVMFHIVNLFFTTYKHTSFRDVNLMRFDEKWTQGAQALTAYRHLMTLICTLADVETRAEASKRISISSALSKSVTGFSDTMIQNITTYYAG